MTYLDNVERLDVVEALLEMRLHGLGVLALAQNLQQVVVRQEVEARENLSLRLQVHVQALLYLFKLVVHIVEILQQTWQSTIDISMALSLCDK